MPSEPCPICLEPLRWWNCVRAPYCRHRFHRGCLQQWKARPGTARCPLCRGALGPWRVGSRHFEGIIDSAGRPIPPSFHADIDLEIQNDRAALVINGVALKTWVVPIREIKTVAMSGTPHWKPRETPWGPGLVLCKEEQWGLALPIPRRHVHLICAMGLPTDTPLIVQTDGPMAWPPE